MIVRMLIRKLQVGPPPGQQQFFVEIDCETFSVVILSFLLTHEGYLSFSGKRMCTIPVNRLED